MELRRKYDLLFDRFHQRGQGHVFDFFKHLDTSQQNQFLHNLEAFDFQEFESLRALARGNINESHIVQTELKPGPTFRLLQEEFPYALLSKADRIQKRGVELLQSGKVALILVAGGQGTRLGFNHPKGLYPLYPLSRRTLFEGFVMQAKALCSHYRAPFPTFYIMTSPDTDSETRLYFADKNFFGLGHASFRFFQQGTLPLLDQNGNLFLEAEGKLAYGPDGHGGCIAALMKHDLLNDMKKKNVEWLFYFQVDNPFVKICDPVFLGLAEEKGADIALKTVRKQEAHEKVGLFVHYQECAKILEYSELSQELAQKRTPDNRLYLNQGNSAIHVFRRSFLEESAHKIDAGEELLPLHRALKITPCIQQEAEGSCKNELQAFKFERFIFDLFPYAKKVVALEVPRESEFLPLKSAQGEGSMVAVHNAMSEFWRSQLIEAGLSPDHAQKLEIAAEFHGLPQVLKTHLRQEYQHYQQRLKEPEKPLIISPKESISL